MSTVAPPHVAGPDRVPVPPVKALAYGLAFAAALSGAVTLGSPWLLLALLAPDLALLTSARELRAGRLDRRAVGAYNAAHHLPSALVAVAIGVAILPMALPFALLWFAHIAMDRTVGYGPRAADGSQRGF